MKIFRLLTQYAFLLVICLLTNQAQAQLTVQGGFTGQQLVQQLLGTGVTASNVNFVCPGNAAGTFNATATNIGLSQGVLLTTGSIQSALGANTIPSAGVDNSAPGDPSLNALAAATTFDACYLEFDFVPRCDTVEIAYVFASEEYPEYVNLGYNDAFAFFISGPGIPGVQNIAVVPGTATPVTIDNVNLGNYNCPGLPTGCTNCGYYVDNCAGTTCQYDGFTTRLVAFSPVIPCQTYHIKLAIADGGDGIYDSGVFLENQGIGCSSGVILSAGTTGLNTNNMATEGCVDGVLYFLRSGDTTIAQTITYQVGGTATNGVDFATIPSTVTFQPGQDSIGFNITAFQDGMSEGLEFLIIVLTDTSCGLVSNDTAIIMISDMPVASFNNSNACNMQPISFFNTSTYAGGPLTQTLWDFGDGNTSTTASPVHSYASQGTYNVQLIVVTADGCRDTQTVSLGLYPSPVANFSFVSTCPGLPVNFTDLSTIPPGNTVSQWNWNFAGTGTSTQQNPSHTFPGSGPYNVDLIAISNNGCRDTVTHSVGFQPSPTPGFTYLQVCEGNATPFTNTSSIGTGTIAGYQWRFGDNGTSTLTNPSHLYTNAGTYNVTMVAVSAAGCSDSITIQVIVNPNPVANFSAPPVCGSFPTVFTDLSSIGIGAINSWSWQFGDGGTSSNQNPSHTYPAYGTYNTSLLVVSAMGCRDSITLPVSTNPQPSANFSWQGHCPFLPIQFTDLSSNVTGHAVNQWQWDFANGSTSVQQNPVTSFSIPGNYNITLISTSVDGCRDTFMQAITIYPQPNANFTAPDLCLGLPTQFTNNSNIGLGAITGHSWNFGDGTGLGSDANPQHQFSNYGTFTVTLVEASDSGCLDTTSRTISVFPNPAPNFTSNVTCTFDTTFFNNTSTIPSGSINSWDWNFGDGGSSQIKSPIHIYNQAGTYTVQLTAVSDRGCIGTISLPAESFLYNVIPEILNDSVCYGYEAHLSASVPPGNFILWYNRNTNTVFQRGTFYNTGPLYTPVQYALQAGTDEGCRGPVVLIGAHVFPRNDYQLWTSNRKVEIPSAIVEFKLTSMLNLVSLMWDFGDGSTSTQRSPVHHYETPGLYDINVSGVDENGCFFTHEWQAYIEVEENVRIDIPNAFSPNGDGDNDVFTISTRLVTDIDFQIFDRWGKLVYQTTNLKFAWDGKDISGTEMPEGVFMYKATGHMYRGSDFTKSGSITLIR